MATAYLILADGTTYKGNRIGVERDALCEIVFNTSMTGYVEILSDPSYCGQGIVLTYPLIGNYGVDTHAMESSRIWADALIVRELSNLSSNATSEIEVEDYLKRYNVTGISGIDTRALTRHIRTLGTMNGVITDRPEYDLEKIKAYNYGDVVAKVSSKEVHKISDGKYKIALFDFGYKKYIATHLINRDCEVTVFPSTSTAEEILAYEPDGIMLSNGPGDPKCNQSIIDEVGRLMDTPVPKFAICLGHQLIALAMGGDTYKLKFGHRGANHPVLDKRLNRIFISSQNHSFAVDENKLPRDCVISHINSTDGTIEGLYYEKYNVQTVQFHPEASAGPLDTEFYFDDFIAKVKEYKESK